VQPKEKAITRMAGNYEGVHEQGDGHEQSYAKEESQLAPAAEQKCDCEGDGSYNPHDEVAGL
jgi:hypothetical protein